MRQSVCIVTPGHLASNPRAIKEADALHEAGYRVTVVAGDFSSVFREFDQEIKARAPWRAVQTRPSPLYRRLLYRTALAFMGAWRRLPTRMPLWLAVAANSPQTAALTRAACAVRADLYIAHYIAALPAAAAAATRHGSLLGFDAEDFHAGEQMQRSCDSQKTAIVRAIEGTFLFRCAHLTASSPMIADAYARLYGRRPVSVLNVFPRGDAVNPPVPRRALSNPGELSAYWFSQTVGLDRGLQSFIEAMAQTRARVTLHIRGSDMWGHGQTLLSLAQSLHIGDRVELLPMASPLAMVELAADYDIGLALETDGSENRLLCLTNKIFTYLLAGRPVMMSDTPAQRVLAQELGEAAALVPLSDPAMIAEQLDGWALSPEKLHGAGTTAWQLACSRYNWQVERQVLLSSVDRAFQMNGMKSCER